MNLQGLYEGKISTKKVKIFEFLLLNYAKWAGDTGTASCMASDLRTFWTGRCFVRSCHPVREGENTTSHIADPEIMQVFFMRFYTFPEVLYTLPFSIIVL